MSHLSSSFINFRLDVSIFGWMSHLSSSCINFRLDVSFFISVDMGVFEVAELESDVHFWWGLSPSEIWPKKDEKWSKIDLNGDVE
ncbi:hypothetical protein V9T40_000651 [Parthenolecanium corni]|uniref:Uncharacterized protein n=1 Tax=Parthenolecanium corni TaxID=536013 RepID=A0AAN9T9X5_9HEMI